MFSSRCRVISLLPSATEILCGIPGGKQLLVARSSEDDYPPDIMYLPTVIDPILSFTNMADVNQQVADKMKQLGTLYVVDKEQVEDLKPDVILTQDLCRVCSIDLMTVERIAQKMDPPPQVLNLSPECLEHMLDNIIQVGQAVGLGPEAKQYRMSLESRIEHVRSTTASLLGAGSKKRVLCLDWVNPYIVGGHWSPQIIDIAGGEPLLNTLMANGYGGRAKKVAVSEVVDAQPDIIIIAACGLDLNTLRQEISKLQGNPEWTAVSRAATSHKLAICDGHYFFNRPGPRLIDTLEFVAGYIHNMPSLIPANFPFEEIIF